MTQSMSHNTRRKKRELKISETVLQLKWKKTTGNIYELRKQITSQQFI